MDNRFPANDEHECDKTVNYQKNKVGKETVIAFLKAMGKGQFISVSIASKMEKNNVFTSETENEYSKFVKLLEAYEMECKF